jgi:hypothetical protein
MNHSLNRQNISEHLQFHVDNRICIAESIFRPGSDSHIGLLKEARELYLSGDLYVDKSTSLLFEATDLGLIGVYEGQTVPLDMPLEILYEAEYHGKNVKLGYPMRGGTKKFYVYVKNPNGRVIKVQFGIHGMSSKVSDPDRRRSFAARHKCKEKKDKTKAGYWACRINRYAHIWGGKTYPGFW